MKSITGIPINSAAEINCPDFDERAPGSGRYTHATDVGLASRRGKHVVRTHAEVEAAKTRSPSPAEGVSFRQAMAGQCENDHFPYSSDPHGKQRS